MILGFFKCIFEKLYCPLHHVIWPHYWMRSPGGMTMLILNINSVNFKSKHEANWPKWSPE